MRVLTAVVCVVGAAGAGAWLLRRTPVTTSSPAPRQAQVPESRAVTARPLAADLPVPAVPEQAPAKPRPTRAPALAASDPGAPSATSAAPDSPAPRTPALTDGKTYAGSVSLPGGAKIDLGGIVWSEAEPRALLNDRITGEGGWVEGFTVVKIEPERVALEKDGLTIFLSLK